MKRRRIAEAPAPAPIPALAPVGRASNPETASATAVEIGAVGFGGGFEVRDGGWESVWVAVGSALVEIVDVGGSGKGGRLPSYFSCQYCNLDPEPSSGV